MARPWGKKKKYHMMKWEGLIRPKDYGGLGFMDTKIMNLCLLSKWVFRLEGGDSDMCQEILRRKYLRHGVFFPKLFTRGIWNLI